MRTARAKAVPATMYCVFDHVESMPTIYLLRNSPQMTWIWWVRKIPTELRSAKYPSNQSIGKWNFALQSHQLSLNPGSKHGR